MEKTETVSRAQQYATELFNQIPKELRNEVIDTLHILGHEAIKREFASQNAGKS